ncbi:unnamed protein product [Nezara viridula]|uniref:Neuropeptide n=1 Tax=Nezara viridula TaxID=85310 RepID=A0A9P0GWE5_NEZVI|nr:unnamed protein product [Nezara viridula]
MSIKAMKFIPILLISLFFVISSADNENKEESDNYKKGIAWFYGMVHCTPRTCCCFNTHCCENNLMCCNRNGKRKVRTTPC